MLDLVLVAADKSIEQAFRGLLGRPAALGIRPVTFDVRVHPHRDPGCYETGHELAATARGEAAHALIVFDLAWDGAPSDEPAALEEHVESQLRPSWDSRGRCVVIAPELEAWVWSDSPHVDRILGWHGAQTPLRQWLAEGGLWPSTLGKPKDPKAAFLSAIRKTNTPGSSALFGRLAQSVGVTRCEDRAFRRTLDILQGWFGRPGGVGHESGS